MKKRVPFGSIVAVVALASGALLLGPHVGTFVYWYRDRQEFAQEAELRLNPELHLPLTPPTQGLYGLVNAFPHVAFESPTELAFSTSDVYVLERAGRLWRFDNGPTPGPKELVLDFSKEVGAISMEEGAVGLALHPTYGSTGPFSKRLFLYYTAHEGDSRFDRLTRFDLDESLNVVESKRLIDQLDDDGDHNGGTLRFGPDGYLYVAIGDEGNCPCGNHQRIDKDLFSGILRIDVDGLKPENVHAIRKQPETGRTQGYWIPNDNPFVGVPGALEEFWSIGLRNPFRFSFDPETGRLIGGDVGRAAAESVFEAKKGTNHRWSLFEGDLEHRFTDAPTIPKLYGVMTPPLFSYLHTDLNLAVIGGVVYRGTKFPELQGRYIYGDNVSGRIWALDLETKENREILTLPERANQGLTAVVPDLEGELCLVTMGAQNSPKANIYRMVKRQAPTTADGEVAAQQESGLPLLLSETGLFNDLATLTPTDAHRYTINLPMWSGRKDVESLRYVIKVAGDPSPEFRPTGEWNLTGGLTFIKHLRAGGKNVETQVLVMSDNNSGYGVAYKWNEDGMDATLVTQSHEDTVAGGKWWFAASEECAMCHNETSGFALAFSSRQLNVGDQLLRLRREGLFRSRDTLTRRYWGHRQPLKAYAELLEIERKLEVEPLLNSSVLDDTERLSTPTSDASLIERVRSYLDANCASCHRPGGMGGDSYDARYEVPMEAKGLTRAAHRPMGDAKQLLSPGKPDASLLFIRLRSEEPGVHMPPVGLTGADPEGVQLFVKWIRSQQ